MLRHDAIYLGTARRSDDSMADPQYLLLNRANRHGLVTGATGTGKTLTLQGLAEGFSRAGVPVFVADVKGDFSGIACRGEPIEALTRRAADIGLTGYGHEQSPTTFWDIFGERGHTVRTTMAAMGPAILARLMGMNNAQRGALYTVFHVAKDRGIRLHTLEDLQTALASLTRMPITKYGAVSSSSVGAIQRQLLILETQGGAALFGQPVFDIMDLVRVTGDGRGVVNVLAAERLMESPRLYSTFLLWLLSELFDRMPEVGDQDRPKLVFFFDEAHLLFDEQNKALLQKVEQIVRMIRSKGVGIYFITQAPQDIPESVLAQLGNRVQHAIRAYTPKALRGVQTAADTFRPNPDLDVAAVISNLVVGEALVSTLDAKGVPNIVQRTLIAPPRSRVGPISDDERAAIIAASPLAEKYAVQPEERAEQITAESVIAGQAERVATAEQVTTQPAAHHAAASAGQNYTASPWLYRVTADGLTETWRYEVRDRMWRCCTGSPHGFEHVGAWRWAPLGAVTAGADSASSHHDSARREAQNEFNANLAQGYKVGPAQRMAMAG